MIDDSDYERYYSDRCDSFVQDENNLDDNQLVPQLSDRDLPGARLSIIQFFVMNDRRLVCYGNTSWGTCAHTLYRRPHNDKIYALFIYPRRESINDVVSHDIRGAELTQHLLQSLFAIYTSDGITYPHMPIYSHNTDNAPDSITYEAT